MASRIIRSLAHYIGIRLAYTRVQLHTCDENFGPAYTEYICDRDGRYRYLRFNGRSQAMKVETRLRVSMPLFLSQFLYSPNSTSLFPTRILSFDPRHDTHGKIPSLRPARFFLSIFSPLTPLVLPSRASYSRHATRWVLCALNLAKLKKFF